MVLSSGEILSIGSGIQSQVGGTTAIRHSVQKPNEEKTTEIPKCKSKYHKIRKYEKYMVKGEISPDYISDTKVPKTNIENLMKLSSKYKLVSFKIPDEANEYYVKSCYMIDFISSPVRYKGEGRKAIKSLVEKSVSDKDTEGRIIVDVKITDGQTSSAGFFYKLGFRFLDTQKNEIMKNWERGENSIISPRIVGMMYLPKEEINRLLMYKMLL